MSGLDNQAVLHVASLANLKINQEELEKFKQQLSETLKYVNRLKEIDTTEVLPTCHVTGLINVYRSDERKISLSQKDSLSQAMSVYRGFFSVPLILNKT